MTPAYDDLRSTQVWLQKDQQFTRQSRNCLPVTSDFLPPPHFVKQYEGLTQLLLLCVVCGLFLACEDYAVMVNKSFPLAPFFFSKQVEIGSHELIPFS